MTKKWSSFEDDALIMESWRKHINEEDVEETQDQQPLEEAVLTIAVVAKLILLLSQKKNIKKVTQTVLEHRANLPKSVITILETIDSAVEVIEKEMPAAVRGAAELQSMAPGNWIANIVVSLFVAGIPKPAPPQPEEEESPISAPTETTTTTPLTE